MFGKYKKNLHNLAAVTGFGLQNYFTFYFEAEKIGNLSPPPPSPHLIPGHFLRRGSAVKYV